MPLIVSSSPVPVNGMRIADFQEDAALRLQRPWNYRPRRPGERVQMIVLHSTKGWPDGKHRTPQTVRERPAALADLGARRTVAYWHNERRFAGAHLVLDADGSALCCADLALDAAYHAGPVNGASVGVEVYQQGDSSFHRAQFDALPPLIGALCDQFGVPRRAAHPYQGKPREGVLAPGVYGHRDLTDNRGAGDPGDLIIEALLSAGWEPF